MVELSDLLYKSPFDLTKEEQNKADELWLYSVGIEIECDKSFDYDEKFFKAIPDMMAVDTDNSEQRYRLPTGYKALVCLYRLTEGLKTHSILNEGSGIHYHTDFTDYYDDVITNMTDDDKDYILSQLDSWEYKGRYNSRNVTVDSGFNWIRFQSGFKTMECRIGEMTFHYPLLLKRILHLQSIAATLKQRCTVNQGLRRFLQEHKFDEPVRKSNYEIEQIVKRRVIKL